MGLPTLAVAIRVVSVVLTSFLYFGGYAFMALEIESFAEDFDPRFKIFHELMARKIRDILLVSTPYDAWILEEDCRLSERIIHEYRGLNLSNPPRFTWASSAQEALAALDQKKFDMVTAVFYSSIVCRIS